MEERRPGGWVVMGKKRNVIIIEAVEEREEGEGNQSERERGKEGEG